MSLSMSTAAEVDGGRGERVNRNGQEMTSRYHETRAR